jgi:hypothetical protein
MLPLPSFAKHPADGGGDAALSIVFGQVLRRVGATHVGYTYPIILLDVQFSGLTRLPDEQGEVNMLPGRAGFHEGIDPAFGFSIRQSLGQASQ